MRERSWIHRLFGLSSMGALAMLGAACGGDEAAAGSGGATSSTSAGGMAGAGGATTGTSTGTGGGAGAGGGCSGRGATIMAASCSDADVQAAIDSAADHDTVLLPSCEPTTWSAGVSIPGTKGITLDGGGAVITGAVTVETNATVGTRITGFTFTSAAGMVFVEIGGAKDAAPYRLDHVTFQAHDVMVRVHGNGAGLIDHDNFEAADAPNEMIHNEGLGAVDDGGWSDDVTPGGPDMVFIEDNTFFFDIEAYNDSPPNYFWGASAVQSYYGARTVFRHNLCDNTQVDQHGTPGMIGARWWEIYENTFHTGTDASQCCYMVLRGGSGVIFDNHHTGTNASQGSIELVEEDTGYPALYQVGRGINQELSPAYVWGNDGDMPVGSGSANVEEDRDFFVSAVEPPMLLRQQLGADDAMTEYAYAPYVYPHPLQACSP